MLEKYADILKVAEVCEILRIHRQTLIRWDKKRIFKPIILNDRGDKRYKKQDIERLLLGTVQTNS